MKILCNFTFALYYFPEDDTVISMEFNNTEIYFEIWDTVSKRCNNKILEIEKGNDFYSIRIFGLNIVYYFKDIYNGNF